MCCATDRPGAQLKSWKYIDETKYLKQADQIGSNKIDKYILYENCKLCMRYNRKPQRQIILELAAAILITNDKKQLDDLITEIINTVEVNDRDDKICFQHFPHTDNFAHTLLSNPLFSLSDKAMSDVSQIINRHTRQKQIKESSEKRETCPQSETLLTRSQIAFFHGTGRCSSPFENNEIEHESKLTAAELVILETIVRCCTNLDLKAHFISRLPNIELLLQKLTVVNLSFNNFRVIPSQIFKLKNLVHLNLRNNPIKELPHAIAGLQQLQLLVVSFCFISCIPISLFTLRKLTFLDLSYNKLSFLPKDIGNLSSLRELNVEGNELGALPTGLLLLNLRHLRMVNNFTHPLFWRETTCNGPQRLFHLAAKKVASDGLMIKAIPEEIEKQLLSPGVCDCCDGPMFGPGVRIIKTVENMFGVKYIPIIFTVCAHTCRRAFKKNPNAVHNWLSKNCKTST
ncbi:leucine-rich repeat-containing protein 63-like [Xenia sp. Carnegie-2017]|uniref:leucine-rich repeat-containing protein 63-like n=1 Tax=Xenia sp. Carnegie-2017 TaxID=2897299 RepID=UPI001F03EF0E|nr:leucine-rich repeat-containing protein 63-like [Xenia sp. Carnegie-2017]